MAFFVSDVSVRPRPRLAASVSAPTARPAPRTPKLASLSTLVPGTFRSLDLELSSALKFPAFLAFKELLSLDDFEGGTPAFCSLVASSWIWNPEVQSSLC
jgi:hypothetical protein